MINLYKLTELAEMEWRPYMHVFRDKGSYQAFQIKQGKRTSVRYASKEDSKNMTKI